MNSPINNQTNMQTSIIQLRHVETDDEILACYQLLSELVADISSTESVQLKIKGMSQQGYRLLGLWEENTPSVLAGYRIKETLHYGYVLYVEDIITAKNQRGKGMGRKLMESIFVEASKQKCSKVILDVGVSNLLAHRFSYRLSMLPKSTAFCYELDV